MKASKNFSGKVQTMGKGGIREIANTSPMSKNPSYNSLNYAMPNQIQPIQQLNPMNNNMAPIPINMPMPIPMQQNMPIPIPQNNQMMMYNNNMGMSPMNRYMNILPQNSQNTSPDNLTPYYYCQKCKMTLKVFLVFYCFGLNT